MDIYPLKWINSLKIPQHFYDKDTVLADSDLFVAAVQQELEKRIKILPESIRALVKNPQPSKSIAAILRVLVKPPDHSCLKTEGRRIPFPQPGFRSEEFLPNLRSVFFVLLNVCKTDQQVNLPPCSV